MLPMCCSIADMRRWKLKYDAIVDLDGSHDALTADKKFILIRLPSNGSDDGECISWHLFCCTPLTLDRCVVNMFAFLYSPLNDVTSYSVSCILTCLMLSSLSAIFKLLSHMHWNPEPDLALVSCMWACKHQSQWAQRLPGLYLTSSLVWSPCNVRVVNCPE